jgi:hypothetical protein
MVDSVGEAARQIKVAALTLRYYDKEGLLPFVERSDGGTCSVHDDLPIDAVPENFHKYLHNHQTKEADPGSRQRWQTVFDRLQHVVSRCQVAIMLTKP